MVFSFLPTALQEEVFYRRFAHWFPCNWTWRYVLKLIIINNSYQRRYKGYDLCLMSVWKSDEKLVIFVSLISPPKIILFEK